MRFSNPSPRKLEKGRLFGSWHTRRVPCSCARAGARQNSTNNPTPSRCQVGWEIGARWECSKAVFTGELPDRFHLGLLDGTVSTALQVGVELIEMFRYGFAGAETGHAFFQPPVRHRFLELFP